jgi:hypothetical protein
LPFTKSLRESTAKSHRQLRVFLRERSVEFFFNQWWQTLRQPEGHLTPTNLPWLIRQGSDHRKFAAAASQHHGDCASLRGGAAPTGIDLRHEVPQFAANTFRERANPWRSEELVEGQRDDSVILEFVRQRSRQEQLFLEPANAAQIQVCADAFAESSVSTEMRALKNLAHQTRIERVACHSDRCPARFDRNRNPLALILYHPEEREVRGAGTDIDNQGDVTCCSVLPDASGARCEGFQQAAPSPWRRGIHVRVLIEKPA